jgi:hypothetical protein
VTAPTAYRRETVTWLAFADNAVTKSSTWSSTFS